jgi:hypothetical protein
MMIMMMMIIIIIIIISSARTALTQELPSTSRNPKVHREFYLIFRQIKPHRM